MLSPEIIENTAQSSAVNETYNTQKKSEITEKPSANQNSVKKHPNTTKN